MPAGQLDRRGMRRLQWRITTSRTDDDDDDAVTNNTLARELGDRLGPFACNGRAAVVAVVRAGSI